MVSGLSQELRKRLAAFTVLDQLQAEQGLTYLFIAHDLSMVKYFSDRIGMMYRGKLVELAEADEIYDHPHHHYTQSLLSAIPQPDPDYERNRQRIHFDSAVLKASDSLSWQEVSPGHWVYQ